MPLNLAIQLGCKDFQRRKNLTIRLLLSIKRSEGKQQSIGIGQAVANLLPFTVDRLSDVVALMLDQIGRLHDRIGQFCDNDGLGR